MKRQTSGAPDLTNKTESECSGLKSGVGLRNVHSKIGFVYGRKNEREKEGESPRLGFVALDWSELQRRGFPPNFSHFKLVRNE